MYEKTASVSLKDMLIKKISEDGGFDINIVEKVIAFQGEDMSNAVKDHMEIEISGFGILKMSKQRIKKRLEKVEKWIDNNPEIENEGEKKKQIREYLNKKLEFLNEKKCQN